MDVLSSKNPPQSIAKIFFLGTNGLENIVDKSIINNNIIYIYKYQFILIWVLLGMYGHLHYL